MFEKYLKTILNGGVVEPEIDPLKEGMAKLDAGALDEALPLLQEAATRDPDNGQIQASIGRLHVEAGRLADAVASLKKAYALEPKNAQYCYQLAEACYAIQDYASAERFFAAATTYDAEFTDAFIRLGMLCAEQGRLPEATRNLERAIYLDRAAVVARYHLANICVQTEDYKRALTQLHLIKELHKDYAPVYLLQGEIFQRLGDNRQAVVELTQAIELGVGESHVYWQLANSHLALNERDQALKCCLQVVRLDPSFWPAYAQAARMYESQKRFAQAHELYTPLLHVPEYQEEATAAVDRIGRVLEEISSALAGESIGEGQ